MTRKPLILVSLLLAAFLINLDTTIVNVALPTLVRQLHASNSQLQWVVDAFNLLFAASVLAAGSLSDRFGRKGMLLAGLSVFGLASLAGGLTDSPGQLIAARAFAQERTSRHPLRRYGLTRRLSHDHPSHLVFG